MVVEKQTIRSMIVDLERKRNVPLDFRWTADVNGAFVRMEEGFSNALRDYHKKQIVHLIALIHLLLGNLNDQDRQKITTLCLIDLHARDVISKMLNLKVRRTANDRHRLTN
jgi:dynein heavy chain, axonemal